MQAEKNDIKDFNTPLEPVPIIREGRCYAEIIIPAALPKNYTWSVPERFFETVKPGCRVEVNLGKSKKYAGIVKALHTDKPEFIETKDILNVLDTEPVIFEEQLKLWETI